MIKDRTAWWVMINDLRKLSSLAWDAEGMDGYTDLVRNTPNRTVPDYAEFAGMVDKQIHDAIVESLDEDEELMDGVLNYMDEYYRKKIEEEKQHE